MKTQSHTPATALLLRRLFRKEVTTQRRGGTMISSVQGDILLVGLFPPLTARGRNCFKGEVELEDVYTFEKLLGKGGYSQVWLAKNRFRPKEEPVAIKMMGKYTACKLDLSNEITILKATHNSNFISQMCGSFQTETHYCIVLKYATRGTLHDRVKIVRCFSELIARFYAAEIADALFTLHQKGIIHRDLNLDNVLICENGHVVVSDFGLSIIRNPEEMDLVCEPWQEGANKPQFPAPELCLGLQYDKTVDWWAFGVVLYRMVTGEYPFIRTQRKSKFSDNYDIDLIFRPETYPIFLSGHSKQFISQLLQRRRLRRLGGGKAEETDVMSTPFFHNVDWGQLRECTVPAPFSELAHPSHHRKRANLSLATSHLETAESTTSQNMLVDYTERWMNFSTRVSQANLNAPATRKRSSIFARTMSWLEQRFTKEKNEQLN